MLFARSPQEENVATLQTFPDKTSTNFKTSHLDRNSKPSSPFVKICVRLIVSEATRIRQEWVVVQTFQDTHKVLMPQFMVLCDGRTMLCSVSTLRLLSILRYTTRLVLLVLQTNRGRHPRVGILCVRHSQL